MKTLYIYYSYTGNGELIADKLASKNIDIRRIIRKKKMPKSFFGGMMVGGFLASIKHKDKLVDFDNNIEEYDEIIIGAPIWNARLSSPINGALAQLDLKDKKVSFVLYSGSGTAKKAVKRINKEYPNAQIIILQEPKKYPEQLEKLKELIKEK